MPVFYFHKQNKLAKHLTDVANVPGFTYQGRGELDFKIQRLLSDAGYDLWPTCHSVIGSLAGSIDLHIPLDPDLELDRYTLKLCKTKAPWSFYKVINGPKMSGVIGYCSAGALTPFAMGTIEQAQKGITAVGFVPR